VIRNWTWCCWISICRDVGAPRHDAIPRNLSSSASGRHFGGRHPGDNTGRFQGRGNWPFAATLTRKVMAGAMHAAAAGGFYVPYEALGVCSNQRPAVNITAMVPGCCHGAMKLGVTQRQYEVLQLIQRGYNNRRIARHLEISEGTVKQHVHAVLGTLGVSSRTEAIAAASRLGFHRE
jgi:DNA-binding CsgD family transcriptional regulator